MQDRFDERILRRDVDGRRGFIEQPGAQDILILINPFIKAITARNGERQPQKVECGEGTHAAEDII